MPTDAIASPVAQTAPGVVARCPTCDQVLLRMVRGLGCAWLDLRDLSYLHFPCAGDLSRLIAP
jgi:hypothetical protein